MNQEVFERLVTRLSTTDGTTQRQARDDVLSFAIDHMRVVAHRMMRGFPQVRRWDETDDIVQGASLRLSRALESVDPVDGRHLLGLIALQVRRELVDLVRRYRGKDSFAHHHETNTAYNGECKVLLTDAAVSPVVSDHDGIALWTRFHEAAAALDDDDRELFNLVWYLGLNQEQAAHTLGCSVRTVARRWDLVKRQLVGELEGQAPT